MSGPYNGTLDGGSATWTGALFGSGALSGAQFAMVGATEAIEAASAWLSDWTINAWVKTSSGSTQVAIGVAGIFWIGSVGGNAHFHYGASAGELNIAGGAINDGNWHHLEGVYRDGVGAQFFVDGVSVGTNSVHSPTSGTDFCIGDFATPDNGFPWSGWIDEVRLSNIARHTSGFSVPVSAYTVDGDTLGLWHLDGDATDAAAWSPSAPVDIPPDDANIVYSPEVWNVGSIAAETINAGAYFHAAIDGLTALDLQFDISGDSSPVPQVIVLIDNVEQYRGAIAAAVTVMVPAAAWSIRIVEVIVKSTTETASRWAPRSTSVRFEGFVTTPSALTTVPIEPISLSGIVFGDSITEGVRTVDSSATDDTDRNDSTTGWAYLLRSLLGCEIGVVGFGGTGWSTAGSGSVPALTGTYNVLWDGGPTRDFTGVDFVVINEGTNDGGDVTTDATTVLDGLIAALDAGVPIILLEPFNATHTAQLAAAVAACTDPARVTLVDTAGWFDTGESSDGLHPYGSENIISIGPRTAEAVRALITETTTVAGYVRTAGATWKPIALKVT